jgi:hypothetical protein
MSRARHFPEATEEGFLSAVETVLRDLALHAGLSSTTRGQGERPMAFLLDCIQVA